MAKPIYVEAKPICSGKTNTCSGKINICSDKTNILVTKQICSGKTYICSGKTNSCNYSIQVDVHVIGSANKIYQSHRRAAKVQASLRKCVDSPELSLLAYTKYVYILGQKETPHIKHTFYMGCISSISRKLFVTV